MFSRGVPQGACLDELAASRPDLVSAAHREYLEAGAELIETLSLGANRRRLALYGLEHDVGRLNRRAAQVAREAREVSGREAFVGGSIGPIAPPSRSATRPREQSARAIFREHIDGLLEGGADVLILETFSDLDQLLLAIEEARQAADVPVIASLTFGEDLALADGTSPERASAALVAAGVDVVGVNCGAGPSASIDAIERMGLPTGAPFRSIMPNAGLPQRLEGRFVYSAGADYFAGVTPRMLAAGARIVGGCCGTTPAHIAAMRTALATAGAATADLETPGTSGKALTTSPSALVLERTRTDDQERPTPTRLAELLATRRFEIDPPRSVRIERTITAARLLREAGVDVVNISDSPMARVRMGALAVASASSTTSTSNASFTAPPGTGT